MLLKSLRRGLLPGDFNKRKWEAAECSGTAERLRARNQQQAGGDVDSPRLYGPNKQLRPNPGRVAHGDRKQWMSR
jgi:hypothetical protein